MRNMVKRQRNTYINSLPDFICFASAIGCKHDSSWLWNCRKQHNYTVEKTHVNIQNSHQTNLVKWSTHLGKMHLEQLTSLIFYDTLWCLPYSFQPRPYILFFLAPRPNPFTPSLSCDACASKWFVGSSSSKTSAERATAVARSKRTRQPFEMHQQKGPENYWLWWFQPIWTYTRQIGSFPQVGVGKNWNHHRLAFVGLKWLLLKFPLGQSIG